MPEPSATQRRRGPRPARRSGQSPETREQIRAAAAELFAAKGYTATTLRAVAEAAGVDVALVPYYFGSKAGLFSAVVQLPEDPQRLLHGILDEGLDGAGERIARTALGVWERAEANQRLSSLLRTAITADTAAGTFGEFIAQAVLPLYRHVLIGPDAEQRIMLVANQMVGLVICRYILRIEPTASMSVDDVVAVLGPTLQHTLTADLTTRER